MKRMITALLAAIGVHGGVSAEQRHDITTAPALKALNIVAATLGISSFLGLVNLLVGVLSVGWLSLQAYGYIKYELPLKRARLKAAQHGLPETKPGDLA